MSSSESPSPFIVGIDLGTTHTVVAFADTLKKKRPAAQLFAIEQLVAPGEFAERPLLPSVRYHPASEELAEQEIRLPWSLNGFEDPVATPVIGELARKLGAKSRGKTITSAKSWLSHPAVDRNADILPWGAPDDVQKISPVIASASYLAYIRAAWNARHKSHPLEKQDVIITIPASFDEMARALTLEAVRLAGLKKVRLLEEPQAVCYDWLWSHRDDLNRSLKDTRLLFICDIGGGTCDFTLVRIQFEDDQPTVDRIAVGDHLMLGGDNIDLSLAHLVEKRLSTHQKQLSTADLCQLVEQCRAVKELLLSQNAPDSAKVTLLGSGSRLIGRARSVELQRQEVEAIVLDGFFPLSSLEEKPERVRSGVVEFGLPYVADPAISKHIAAFLKNHENVSSNPSVQNQADFLPDAVLLNGGLFRSQRVSDRLMEILSDWTNKEPRQLENPNPELAVAFGAVAYGLALRGEHVKIGGGSARHYFIQVEDHQKKQRGICILPKGSQENQEIRLADREFMLRLGQPVRFHLLSSTEEKAMQPGELVELDNEHFVSLPPLAVTLDAENAGRQQLTVALAASMTELGILKLQCVATDDATDQRWNVQFQLRKKHGDEASSSAIPKNFSSARERIIAVFGSKTQQKTDKLAKGLRNDLEKLLGNRNDWDTVLTRELFGVFIDYLKNRRRSVHHERVWLSLAGFCLRPGFGVELDDWRIDQIWRIYGKNPQFVNETQNWTEWWTLWRRVAGGLDQARQQQLYNGIAKYLNPASARQGKTAKEIKQRGYGSIVRLAGVLERLPTEQKIEMGHWLLKRLEKPSEPEQTWWAVGRIAARVPFHGEIHNVIPPKIAQKWLDIMLQRDWGNAPQIAFAAALVGRFSGDRERDLTSSQRDKVLAKLQEIKAPKSWSQLLERVGALDESDAKRAFGESLPPGLRLIE